VRFVNEDTVVAVVEEKKGMKIIRCCKET
jgi:hypothetical protein